MEAARMNEAPLGDVLRQAAELAIRRREAVGRGPQRLRETFGELLAHFPAELPEDGIDAAEVMAGRRPGHPRLPDSV
jgi:hypothetical protein